MQCCAGGVHLTAGASQHSLQAVPVRGLLSLLCSGGRLLRAALCCLHRTLGCTGLRLQLLIVLNDGAGVQDKLLGITLQEQGLSGHAACCCDAAHSVVTVSRQREDAQMCRSSRCMRNNSMAHKPLVPTACKALEGACIAAHSPVLDAASVWRPSPSPAFAPVPLESRQHTDRWRPWCSIRSSYVTAAAEHQLESCCAPSLVTTCPWQATVWCTVALSGEPLTQVPSAGTFRLPVT